MQVPKKTETVHPICNFLTGQLLVATYFLAGFLGVVGTFLGVVFSAAFITVSVCWLKPFGNSPNTSKKIGDGAGILMVLGLLIFLFHLVASPRLATWIFLFTYLLYFTGWVLSLALRSEDEDDEPEDETICQATAS